jgi:hypothetical protein
MPKRLTPNLPLVLVEWVDSARGVEWAKPDATALAHRVCSVGWLYKQTKDAIALMPHIGLDEEGEVEQVVGNMDIPRRAIVRMRTLRRGRL